MNQIFEAIQRERSCQDRKYGTPQERALLPNEYLHIAQVELNEAMSGLVNGDLDNALCEALQVAAVLVAMMEQHGIRERGE
jgi:hypothetical protein